MRQAFSQALPHVPVLPAEATLIPVDDGTFDAVFIAQAFHWFSHDGE
jgi:ubiquinone/menaquinone biosynthesis C-methylase UbiE